MSSHLGQNRIAGIRSALVEAFKGTQNEQGVYYAIVVPDTCMTLAGVYIFRKGK